MARFYEKLTKPTALADGDIFVISVGSGTSWIDYKITYSQLKDVIKTISDMQNYYTKSQTYTQAEVNAAISSAIGAVYKPSGSKTCAELVSSLLIAANKGNVYNITDSGVTTEDFVDGAGKTINAGDNVSIVEVSTDVFKFDLLSGFIDLTGYQTKNLASAIEGQTTVEGALAALSANKANLSEVYTKTQINDDFVKKSATAGLLKNDGSVDTNTYVPAVTGKGLSTEDYTSPEKAKLAGISDGATKTESSLTNGHLEIDDVDIVVYDDTALDSRVDVVEQDLSTDTATATGNPLNFSTRSAQKAKETVISLEPIQDLHGYDHPWPAGGGKNKVDVPDITGFTRNYIFSGKTLKAGTYTLSLTVDGQVTPMSQWNIAANGSTLITASIYSNTRNSITFTLSSDTTTLQSYCNTEASVNIKEIMIEEGSTATSFAPYSNICPIDGRTETSLVGTNGKESTDPDYVESNNLTIQFGEKVYGATVELEKGTVTVDTAIVDMGEQTYLKRATSTTRKVLSFSVSQNYKRSELFGVCEKYKVCGISNVTDLTNNIDTNDLGLYVYSASETYNIFYLLTILSDTPSGTLVYELATPRTIQLTPQQISLLQGVNNISTDADGITLTYRDGKVATLGDLEGLTKKIADCEDVEITDLQAGDSLVWDATAGKWKNQQSTNTHVYSTTEQVVGTWIDGSTIYEKTIDCGSMPNNDTKQVAHGISNLGKILSVSGFAYNSSGTSLNLPYLANDFNYMITISCSDTNVSITARMDRSSFNGYLTIQYTKTTPTLLMQSTPTEESTPADESESTDENR